MTLPLRVRLALFSGVLVGVVVIALGAFVYLKLEADMRAVVDDGLAERAQDLIADPPEGGVIEVEASDIGDSFGLIVTATGKLVASTAGLDSFAILAEMPVSSVTSARAFEFDLPTDEGPQAVRVLATPGAADMVVLTGVAFDDQRATLGSLAQALALAVPTGVLLGIATGWLVGGAALRPVDRMRREAEVISASEPDRRLSVPPTRDELAALGLSLNRMLDRLQAAVERERRVVDNASHELRTPLANMKAELDLALRQPRSEAEMRSALSSAADETDRLSRLAADLLLLARLHGGQLPVKRQAVDVSRLVASAIDGFTVRAANSDVRLESEVEPDLIVNADEQRLRQALDNLIDNALRHAPRGETVQVQAAARDGLLVLAVADSGPGFPDGFLAHAFEPFSRTDEGRTREEGGAGLGLAIVRAVAEAHRGTVTARNRPAGGALVEMRIPL